MENKILIRKDRPSNQVMIISFFIQLFGIIMISTSDLIWWKILIGAILLFIGLIVFSLKSEQYFDCDTNSLIIKWKSFFLSKSKMEKLPEINYLAIVRVKTTKNLNYKSISVQEGGYMCNLNLIYKESKQRYRRLCTVDKDTVFHLAKELSEKMNKPILDNSTPNKQWINK